MAEPNHTRLVIFDCDGVLVDSEPIACRVMARELTRLGYPLSPDDCQERFTGVSMKTVMAMIEADWQRPLPAGFEERLREQDFAAFRAELAPVAGVEAMLERLTLPRCVASSGAPQKIRFTLTVTGLIGAFEPYLFSARMVARGKPAPDLFLYAAERMGTPPEACVVVEDAVAGIRAARAAGMRVLGFAGAGHAGPGYAEKLAAAGADTVFTRMAYLPHLLTRPARLQL
jgi:HAD superfamily hydrolase (TIGR01509 family)